ncbi:hypothetical protein ACIQWL_55865 [Streptomyces mirabilis]|jgi:hypothetical protein|uniref:hypothetical protein n=1 Tax=Streptomyces mirabilis TaxID=68239 RepID=UPI000765EB95|nr:hypothetical protein [Streptomyces mirabilis]MCX4428806.1 hypothetical protein [Streptomyces mirabilis]
MVPLVRPRRFALAVAAVLGGLATVAACAPGNGDPDPQAVSEIAVCTDVPVHAWVTMNIGTETRPENRKVDYDVEASGHGRDPFGRTEARGCDRAAGAFGSRVVFKAPGLNGGRPYSATAPADAGHLLVVRFTKHADDTVTGTQELVNARE